ncbi:MAG: hypothetical protein PHZ19_02090 [Candidatus Thermoplasmatota archaeon]|nr:hypothetical protein [Candidatus Thermoplasmatota archaeon]
MGQMNIKISDELEQEFRLTAVEKYGPKRGFLVNAVTEAFTEWVKKNKHK